MGELLTNNIFFVYLLGILGIINYSSFGKCQKIAIIYACTFGLTFNNDLTTLTIVGLLFSISFLYEEYLDSDIVKSRYVTKFRHKIIDYLYMYIFQYKIVYILAAIIIQSQVVIDCLKEYLNEYSKLSASLESILLILSIIVLILGIHKMFTNPVELNSFSQMDKKFDEYPYYKMPLSDKNKREIFFEKLELVADIEDYTFFKRKKSYRSFSIEFIKIVLNKRIQRKKNAKINSLSHEKRSVKKILKKIVSAFKLRNLRIKEIKKNVKQLLSIGRKVYVRISLCIKNFLYGIEADIKKYVRGYSTIEMQLIRIIAYKKGLFFGRPKKIEHLYLVLTRKLFEILYAPMFFGGKKLYLDLADDRDYFRHYIVYVYLHTVQTKLNGKTFVPLDKLYEKVDVIEWKKEVLFIITLGLSGARITKKRVDLYNDIIVKYDMDRELIDRLVERL